ncbi:MAG: hypothetical protein ACOCQG_05440 [Candidatus Nanoarchaeia archaeon]
MKISYYVDEIIDYLEAKKIKCIILCPEKKEKSRIMSNRQTNLGNSYTLSSIQKKKAPGNPRQQL